jgi:hypothetical protein
VRFIIAVFIVCFTATRAFAFGAVSAGKDAAGTMFGIATDQQSEQAAVDESRRLCVQQHQGGAIISDRCLPISLFKNRCAAIVGARSIHFSVGIGDTKSEALANGAALCRFHEYLGICQLLAESCDTIGPAKLTYFPQWPAKTYDAVIVWWINTTDDIQGWWDDNVTTSVLIVSAAFLVLSVVLVFMFLQMRRLKRLLGDRAAPNTDAAPQTAAEVRGGIKKPARAVNRAKRPWWLFGIFPPPRVDQVLAGMQQQTMGRHIKEPIDEPEPKLDTRSIKQAFKATTFRREEFEV